MAATTVSIRVSDRDALARFVMREMIPQSRAVGVLVALWDTATPEQRDRARRTASQRNEKRKQQQESTAA
jgi:hypothetical protein